MQDAFWRDYDVLTRAQQARFGRARQQFLEDLGRGSFRPGLRVKRVVGHTGVWELTWAPDGRATFHYGPELTARS